MQAERIQQPYVSHTLPEQRAEQGRSTIADHRESAVSQAKMKDIIQRVRIGRNVVCPSWGFAPTLGSYIHGLFQTQFLKGVAPVPPPAPVPLVPNRQVEVLHGVTYADLGLVVPGGGWQYGEIKPNSATQAAAGAAQMGAWPAMPFANVAAMSIPLRLVDPRAPVQHITATGNPYYPAIPGVAAAPAIGAVPNIQLFQAPAAGVFCYDAW